MWRFKNITKYFSENLNKFTSFNFESKEEKDIIPKVGRAWRSNELRLKSNEDLHKLWYVLLMERNAVVSDNAYLYKLKGEKMPEPRITKIKTSMARLLTIISERKKYLSDYRKELENDYVEKKRKEYEDEMNNLTLEEQIKVPKISFNLLRAKYHDLKRGVDNTDYIKEAVEIKENKEKLLDKLKEKYNYKKDGNKNINGFNNYILEQIKNKEKKVSNEEILRAHIKNWKILTLKQRRSITAMINAKRAKDAKNEFLKELNLLSQKIAYDKNN